VTPGFDDGILQAVSSCCFSLVGVAMMHNRRWKMFENKFDPGQLDELTRSVLNKLPSGLQDVQRDVEKNLRAA
jgi:hypothetical protein